VTSSQRPPRQLCHGKRSRTDRHRPQQSWPDPLPEAAHALGPPGLREAVPHGLVSLPLAEPIRLHLALHHVQRVARQPQRLARQAAVQRDLVRGDPVSRHARPPGVRVHQPLEGEEPHAVGLGLAQHRDRLAAVQAVRESPAGCRYQLAHAVPGPAVQPPGPMRLRLQPDADMLDGARYHAVGHAGECARRVVLAVAELVNARDEGCVSLGVGRLEPAPRCVEPPKLDGHTCANAEERCQSALVEGEGALILPDGEGRSAGGRVGIAGLQANFDNVEGLTWAGVS
jgi:hypothetical protein